jgi:hypothetical protein
MRTKYFETCEDLDVPQLIYIRDVKWAEENWDAIIASPGVVAKQKPHFVIIEDQNDRLLFLMRWSSGTGK